MKKKLLLFASTLLLALGALAADFKVATNGGDVYYNIVDAAALTCEYAPNPDGPYNLTFTSTSPLPATVTNPNDGQTYTVIGVGENAFKDGVVNSNAASGTIAYNHMWWWPNTISYIRAGAFENTKSNFPCARFNSGFTPGSIDKRAFINNRINQFNPAVSGDYYKVTNYNAGNTGDAEGRSGNLYCEEDGKKILLVYGGDHHRSSWEKKPNGTSADDNPYYTLTTRVDLSEFNVIGENAFYGNQNIQQITFGANLEAIETDAFKNATAISTIICNATTPPTGGVFDDAVYDRIRESGSITVPADALEAYKADANWGKFWTAPAAAPKMYIAGSFTNWADGKLEMTETDGVYSITVNGIQQWAEFKFIEEDGETTTWYGGDTQGGGDKYGVHPDWCTGIALAAGDAGSNFQVTSGSGDLTFTIDADKKLTITGWAAPANELYLAGSMTNWADNKEAMTLDEQTGKFSITKAMEAGAEFKFVDQDGAWIGGDANGNFVVQREQVVNGTELTLLLNAGNNFQIPVAGTWTLTVDKATMKLVIAGEWPAPKYAITVAEAEHGTVEADKAEAEEGETVTLTVTPAEGYELDELEVIAGADTPVETTINTETGKYTFTMPAEIVSIVVTFKLLPPPTFAITVAEAEHGAVVADKAEALEGETVTLTATPDEGYELASLTYTVEGAEPVAIENGAFTMPAANVTINATFTAIDYTITVAETEHGTVTAPATAHFGDNVTLTVAPAEGYELTALSYTVEGAEPVAIENLTFTMPAANVTINATFQPLPVVLDGVAFASNVYASWYGNADLALPEGVTAYVVTGIEDDATVIEPVGYIPAGVGVLLYSTTPAEAVSTMPYTGETATVTSMLQGGLEEMAITDGYVLYGDEFVRTLGGTLAAHRCYLPMLADAAGAPRLRIVGNGEVVTAIADIDAARSGKVTYVDPMGRVSDKPFQGINIVIDGNKVSKMVK